MNPNRFMKLFGKAGTHMAKFTVGAREAAIATADEVRTDHTKAGLIATVKKHTIPLVLLVIGIVWGLNSGGMGIGSAIALGLFLILPIYFGAFLLPLVMQDKKKEEDEKIRAAQASGGEYESSLPDWEWLYASPNSWALGATLLLVSKVVIAVILGVLSGLVGKIVLIGLGALLALRFFGGKGKKSAQRI